MNYSWNWGVLFAEPYLSWIIAGVGMTFAISICAFVVALAIGAAVGTLHSTAHVAGRTLAGIYISIFRNIPLLLQMFIWYFVIPELLPADLGHWVKRDMPYPEIVTGIVALALFTSARVAVQVSAGIAAVPRGQRLAAMAAGMSAAQAYRLVLLPQAFRLIIPPLTSECLTIFKNSSIALTIGVYELTAQTQRIQSQTYQGFEAFTAATVIYLTIALTVTFTMRTIERRVAIPGTSAGA